MDNNQRNSKTIKKNLKDKYCEEIFCHFAFCSDNFGFFRRVDFGKRAIGSFQFGNI